MAFKFVVLAAFVACTSAGILPAGPLSYSAGPSVAYSAGPSVAYSAGPAVAYSAGPALAYKSYAAPVITKTIAAAPVITKTVDDEYDPHPQYNYGYDVHDSITGDVKSQQETRDGDVVRGSYSLLEADGTRRVVEYTADDHNGFNAVVHKEPATVAVKAVAAAPVVTKTYAAAPVAHYAAAPVVAKTYAAAPFGYSAGYLH